jgi:hypothetical protein
MARGRFVWRVQERVYFIVMLSLTVTFLFADQNLMAPNVRRPHPPGCRIGFGRCYLVPSLAADRGGGDGNGMCLCMPAVCHGEGLWLFR